MQRDDARQRRDAAHELTELVIAAREADLDGQLGVEVALLLALRLKQLLLEPRGQPRLGDVDEQIGHLGLAGQLAQQRAEGALDVLQLLLVDFEVDGLGVLGAELLAQLLLFRLVALQLRALLVPHEEINERQRQHDERQRHGARAHRQRPAAGLARIE